MLTTSAITGFVYGPDGAALPNARLVFELQGFDTEAPGDVIAGGVRRVFTLTALGAMPAGAVLWRNTSGLRGTFYKVTATWTETEVLGTLSTERRLTAELGFVQVGSASSYSVQQLLDNPVPAAPSWNVNLSGAVYAQLLADIAETRTQATAAATNAASALSSAVAAGAQIYPTAAAGIAAVATGAVFYVPNAIGGLDVRQKTGASTSISVGQFLPPTQSRLDATIGRLLRVGDHGIGLFDGVNYLADVDSDSIPQGLFQTDGGTPGTGGTFPAGQNRFGHLLSFRVGVNQSWQLFKSIIGDRIFSRMLTAPGTWGPWREIFHAGSILGTVSQSGGVPTGRVIERGSNANGEFVRFADGTQICTRVTSPADAPDTAIGALFVSGQVSWTFPAAFAAAPVAFGSVSDEFSYLAFAAPSTTAVTGRAHRPVAGTTTQWRISAIGRWF